MGWITCAPSACRPTWTSRTREPSTTLYTSYVRITAFVYSRAYLLRAPLAQRVSEQLRLSQDLPCPVTEAPYGVEKGKKGVGQEGEV